MTLNDLVALISGSNPMAGVIGAAVLFVVQLLFKNKLPNLTDPLRNAVVKPAAPEPADHPVLDWLMQQVRERVQKRLTGSDDPLGELQKISATLGK